MEGDKGLKQLAFPIQPKRAFIYVLLPLIKISTKQSKNKANKAGQNPQKSHTHLSISLSLSSMAAEKKKKNNNSTSFSHDPVPPFDIL